MKQSLQSQKNKDSTGQKKFILYSSLLFLFLYTASCNTSYGRNATLVYKIDDYPINHLIWSQTGKYLAFSSLSGSLNRSSIYILNADTKEIHLLQHDDFGHLEAITWIPDESGLVFSANSSNEFQDGVWITYFDTGATKYFLDDAITIAWSSKNMLAISRGDGRGGINISLKDMTTNEELPIFNDNAIAIGDLAWSADGNKLVFSLDHGEFRRSDIYLFDMNSQETHQITGEGDNLSPALSPDGSLVAYIKGDFSGPIPSYDLHIMNSDGTCDIKVPDLIGVGSPAWSPDGLRIAFTGRGNKIYVFDLFKAFGESFFLSGTSCH
jgi:Tol biopolymer transport system component